MSLESKIEALTASINNLINVLSNTTVSVPVAAPTINAAAVQAPGVPTPVAAIEVPVAPVAAPAAAPVMPAPPSFIAPTPAPVAAPAAAPFSDANGMMQYVMASYQTLGQEKGAQIQTILGQLGCGNINEVKPEQYGALYQAVEALKAA